jgi:hypothetical protein
MVCGGLESAAYFTTGEPLQKLHNAGSWSEALFLNTLIGWIARCASWFAEGEKT